MRVRVREREREKKGGGREGGREVKESDSERLPAKQEPDSETL